MNVILLFSSAVTAAPGAVRLWSVRTAGLHTSCVVGATILDASAIDLALFFFFGPSHGFFKTRLPSRVNSSFAAMLT